MFIHFYDYYSQTVPIFTVNYECFGVKPSVGEYVFISKELYKVINIIIDYNKNVINVSVEKEL